MRTFIFKRLDDFKRLLTISNFPLITSVIGNNRAIKDEKPLFISSFFAYLPSLLALNRIFSPEIPERIRKTGGF